MHNITCITLLFQVHTPMAAAAAAQQVAGQVGVADGSQQRIVDTNIEQK